MWRDVVLVSWLVQSVSKKSFPFTVIVRMWLCNDLHLLFSREHFSCSSEAIWFVLVFMPLAPGHAHPPKAAICSLSSLCFKFWSGFSLSRRQAQRMFTLSETFLSPSSSSFVLGMRWYNRQLPWIYVVSPTSLTAHVVPLLDTSEPVSEAFRLPRFRIFPNMPILNMFRFWTNSPCSENLIFGGCP